MIETANHFRCIDLIIESAKATLTEKFIKKLHQILKEWNQEKGYLTDTCLMAQDKYKAYLDFFRIEYEE